MARVLLIDKSMDNIRSYCDALLKDGHEVQTGKVASRAQILDLLRQAEPDLVILDPIYPDVTPTDLLQEIRRLHESIRVIFYLESTDDPISGLFPSTSPPDEVDAILTLPDVDELTSEVGRILSEQRVQSDLSDCNLRHEKAAPKSTILVVDDLSTVRLTIRFILEHSGYSVVTAVGSTEALNALRQYADEIAVIMIDIRLDGESGLTLFQKVRRISPQLPVIFCTAYSLLASHLIENTKVQFLDKPVDSSELMEKVAMACESR